MKSLLIIAALVISTYGHGVPMPNLRMSDILQGPKPKNVVCPPPKEIKPCTCVIRDCQLNLNCTGSQISQENVDKLFQSVRRVNKVTDKNLNVFRFDLVRTEMTELSINEFKQMSFTILVIGENSNLESFTGPAVASGGPEPPTPDNALFDAMGMFLGGNQLTDQGVAPIMDNVNQTQVKVLGLNNNKLQGQPGKVVHGLDTMTELIWLILDSNNIQEISNAPFDNNQKIRIMTLTNNSMNLVGDRAFTFDERGGCKNESVYLMLNNNNLGSDGVRGSEEPTKFSDTAFSETTRTMYLFIYANNLETLTQSPFQSYLDQNTNNALLVYNNNFQCDQRMSWLRDSKKQKSYESRVGGTDCKNDKNETAFTSKKTKKK